MSTDVKLSHESRSLAFCSNIHGTYQLSRFPATYENEGEVAACVLQRFPHEGVMGKRTTRNLLPASSSESCLFGAGIVCHQAGPRIKLYVEMVSSLRL